MPGTRVIVISDPRYIPASENLPQHIVWRPIAGDYSRSNLMIQRLQSYIVLLYISFALKMSKECSGRLHRVQCKRNRLPIYVYLVLIHYLVVMLLKSIMQKMWNFYTGGNLEI